MRRGKTGARFLPLLTAPLLALLAFLLLGCDPTTTEQPGPDPRIEAEVERLRGALEASPAAVAMPALLIALVDGGELHFLRSFGQTAGQAIDPNQVFEVPQLLPTLLAVGLERLVDQGRLALPDSRRLELLTAPDSRALALALAAELEKAAGQSWRSFLQQEILDPLAMKKTRLPEGAEPRLEATADDLVRLMVDLQKSSAGRSYRRLRQEGAQRLLRPLDDSGRGFGLEFGGQGQAAYFSRQGRASNASFLWLGFYSSGNGAVVIGPTDEAVSRALHVVALTYDWPALKG